KRPTGAASGLKPTAGSSLPHMFFYLAAILSAPEISATLPSRRITVTLSAPFLYQQVSTALEDSTLLMDIEGFPTFLSRSARSMPMTSAAKSAGSAGGAGGGAVVAAMTVAGAAGDDWPIFTSSPDLA